MRLYNDPVKSTLKNNKIHTDPQKNTIINWKQSRSTDLTSKKQQKQQKHKRSKIWINKQIEIQIQTRNHKNKPTMKNKSTNIKNLTQENEKRESENNFFNGES